MDREFLKGSVATIGVFDGVHVGHARVLEIVSRRARALGLSAVVLTFDPHPDEVLGKLRERQFLLTTHREKHALLANLSVDVEIVLKFTPAMGRLDASSFVEEYLLKSLNVKELVIGHDFRMGKDRKGDRALLRSLGESRGFSVDEVDAVLVDGVPVSSTRVRQAISMGDMALAARLLGRSYSIEGLVVKGDGIGARMRLPTANLSADKRKLLPPDGVYAGYAGTRGKAFKAAINVGVRPTVGSTGRRVEAHLVEFDDDIRGEPLRLEFVARIRPEKRFADTEDLRKAIKRDIDAAVQLLDNAAVRPFS